MHRMGWFAIGALLSVVYSQLGFPDDWPGTSLLGPILGFLLFPASAFMTEVLDLYLSSPFYHGGHDMLGIIIPMHHVISGIQFLLISLIHPWRIFQKLVPQKNAS